MILNLIPYSFRLKFYDDASQILPPLNPKSPYPKLYYINGIETSMKECVEDARVLLKTFGADSNVIPAYSKSFGLVKDLSSVWIGRHLLSYDSIFAKIFQNQLIEDIEEMEKRSDPRKLFIVAFSRGGIDAYHAVHRLSSKQRDRLFLITCGSAMILPRDLGYRVDNLISKGDIASLYLHPDLTAIEQYAEISLLERKDGFRGVRQDHFFASLTYQEALKNYETIYKEKGSR